MQKTKGWLILIMIMFSLFNLTSCEDGFDNTYEQITPEQAKQIIDSGEDCVILDVRTESEYAEGHIKDALLLDYQEIKEKASDVLPDKNALILVYCRSGRRSKIAAQTLVDLGYTNVKEFGGIIDWPYDTVS